MSTTNTEALPAQDAVSSYDVIRLLLNGGLERIETAKLAYQHQDSDGWDEAISKAIGIVNGLRMSLDMAQGGELASNLDSLYDYILRRLMEAYHEGDWDKICEVGELLETVKAGWDGIETDDTVVQSRVAVA